MISENEFFRNTAMRICGSLQIEEGLRSCVEYMSKHMPADRLYLERHENDLGAMRILARASADKGEMMDLLVPYSEEAREVMSQLAQVYVTDALPPVLVINEPQKEPVTRHLLKALGEPSSSALSLPLFVDDRLVGALALLAEGEGRFNEHHMRLYETLKEPFFVALSNFLEHQEVVRLRDSLADDYRHLNRELIRISGDEIIGADFGLKAVMEMVSQVAPTESPVLLTGETGVGKDVIANAIHLGSPRRDGPFIAVNCGAIPDTLLDSELFGHEKGAFTGALSQKRGRFERANKGTILLDEIGEMPLEAQVRLLRVLQNREIERIGGTKRIPLDIRIIASTNQDLKQMIQAGRFREDLYFRLNVFPILVPSLRERAIDIPALVHHFVERKSKELKIGQTPKLAKGAIDVLKVYQWPGNVRELENVVERAIILHRGGSLSFPELEASLSGSASSPMREADSHSLDLDSAVARHITQVLEMTEGKVFGPGGAGELLGVNPNTLRYKMRKLGIQYRKDKKPR